MPILVFAEQRNGALRKSSTEAITQGRVVADNLGVRLAVSIIGQEVSDLSGEISGYGADDILVADGDVFSFYQTDTYCAVLTAAMKELTPQVVLMAHTAMGKDLAPRVAERMGAGLVSDCTGMVFEGRNIFFLCPKYAGKIIAKINIDSPIQMATLRPNNFPICKAMGEGKERSFSPETQAPRVKVKDVNIQMDGRPDLTEAEVIVSGGRGLGKAEGFQLIKQLADELGAAIGASRAAVDAGWQSHQDQVGQTGKVVTPKVYVACGISGAIQHMAGMGSSKYIVAINIDPEANIMKVADMAVEGDLYKVIPELVNQLKNKEI